MVVFRKYFRIDLLFAITGLLVLLVGFLFFDSALDINVHDTQFSISHAYISFFLSAIFLLFALIYGGLIKAGKQVIKGLNIFHYILTLFPCFTAMIIWFIELSPNRYIASEHMSEEMDNMAKLYILFSMSLLLFLLGQIFFLVNIAISLIRKKAVK